MLKKTCDFVSLYPNRYPLTANLIRTQKRRAIMNRHRIKYGYLAPALLMLTTPGAAAFDQVPQDAENTQRQRTADAIDADPDQALPVSGDLVRLEESLQWTGRDAVELPVSFFATDLLPGNC